MGTWKNIALSEVSRDISYGYTASANSQKVGPRFLRITDIQNGVVDWNNVPYCQIEEQDIPQYRLGIGDIVVARTGNSTGENYIYSGREETVFASYLIRFQLDTEQVDPFYVWYNMRSPRWWAFINSSKTGSAQAGANAKVLGTFQIQLPPLPTQRSIASILGTLDDKIELNRRMNETLESMARAIYKSWFVDFDPVHAKAAGKMPFGIDEETAGLFPDGFEESGMGRIPKGWRVTKLESFVETISNTHRFDTEKVIFLNTSDILDGEFLHREYSFVEGLPGQAKKSIQKGDILFSEIRPANKRYAFVDFDAPDYVVSTKLMVLRCRSIDPIVVYYFLKSEEVLAELQVLAESRSGTFPQITFDQIKQLPLFIPQEKILKKYSELLMSLFTKIRKNQHENNCLINLRDTLLPRLLSGEISIP